MNQCKDCGAKFQPMPGKEWATQCFDCWKKSKAQTAAPKQVTNQFAGAVAMNDDRRQQLIIRQNVLQRAVEFALAGKIEVAEGDNVMMKLFELAERLEAWVNR